MLIDVIRIKGFLSHYGQQNSNGSIEFNEADFRDASLWLVHGANGAGKSALVFDAVGLALYGEHRGGRQNTDYLIHQNADEATIEVELTLDDQRYKVQCTLRKKSPKVSGIVYEWGNNDWQIVHGTENNVGEWAEQRLHMRWPTFQSTVLLRQGEADVFLEAKPKDRHERLMELIDLSFYKRLGMAAWSKRQTWRSEREHWQDQIDNMENKGGYSDEDIAQQKKVLEQARKVLKDARELHDAKKAALETARRAQNLKDDLEGHREKLATFKEVLAQAEQIERNYEHYNVLNKVIPRLENLYGAHARLREAEQDQHDLQEQVETLDEELQSIREELEVVVPVVERQRERQDVLERGMPLFKGYFAASEEVVRRKKVLKEAEITQAEAKTTLSKAHKVENDAERAVEVANSKHDKLKEKVEADQQQIRLLQDKIKHRHNLTGEDECPVCGSQLNSEEVQQRLLSEREKWQAELDELSSKEALLAENLEAAATELQGQREVLKEAKTAVREAEQTKVVAQADFKNATKEVEEAQQALKQAKALAEAWAAEGGDLNAPLGGFKEVVTASRRIVLQEVEETQQNAVSAVKAHRQMLHSLSDWSLEKHEKICAVLEDAKQVIGTSEIEVKQASEKLNHAQEAVQALQKDEVQCQTKKQGAAGSLAKAKRQTENVEQEVKGLHATLPADWREHPAKEDEAAIKQLKEELESLSETPEAVKDLQNARSEAGPVTGVITKLKSQLEEIPMEHRRPVEEVENEIPGAEEDVQVKEKAQEDEVKALEAIQQQRQQFANLKTQRDEAAKEYGYYERLAKAFGRKGLQARIIQNALDRVRQNANKTLGRLSQGTLQIDLEGEDELEILVRDLSQPGTPARAFTYLSGGEKFRVAVSLAVGIGQSVSGGRSADTLLIDEGFGALDDKNRELMVDELRRLSQDVLTGGRVIVVSHQEDVQEGFTQQYIVSKDEVGHAQIKQVYA